MADSDTQQRHLGEFASGDADSVDADLEAQMAEVETLVSEAKETNAKTREALRGMDEMGEALADLEEAAGADVPYDAEQWADIPSDQQVTIAKSRLKSAIDRLTGETERGYNGSDFKGFGFE